MRVCVRACLCTCRHRACSPACLLDRMGEGNDVWASKIGRPWWGSLKNHQETAHQSADIIKRHLLRKCYASFICSLMLTWRGHSHCTSGGKNRPDCWSLITINTLKMITCCSCPLQKKTAEHHKGRKTFWLSPNKVRPRVAASGRGSRGEKWVTALRFYRLKGSAEPVFTGTGMLWTLTWQRVGCSVDTETLYN